MIKLFNLINFNLRFNWNFNFFIFLFLTPPYSEENKYKISTNDQSPAYHPRHSYVLATRNQRNALALPPNLYPPHILSHWLLVFQLYSLSLTNLTHPFAPS
jgi:hypothetical protein